jgi:nicotinate-nucleotide pyrophosphorylase (carboxylating)
MTIDAFIEAALAEDTGSGDHTSIACIPSSATGRARLIVKQPCVIAGIELASRIYSHLNAGIRMEVLKNDGADVQAGEIAFNVEGPARLILTTERLVLNCMQRMSGIATITAKYARAIEDLPVKLLDTRKTTPLIRMLEKWAVQIGGGENHRFGLYDMIMIKDNHVDYAGGISNAIYKANEYLKQTNLSLAIEIETRNLDEVAQVLACGNVQRIMLDNFTPELLAKAVAMIGDQYETEASGGITLENIRDYALTGVNYISCGAITHSVPSVDMSLKAYR